MNNLKKILGELIMVLDQVEAELEKRNLEYQGMKYIFSNYNLHLDPAFVISVIFEKYQHA